MSDPTPTEPTLAGGAPQYASPDLVVNIDATLTLPAELVQASPEIVDAPLTALLAAAQMRIDEELAALAAALGMPSSETSIVSTITGGMNVVRPAVAGS